MLERPLAPTTHTVELAQLAELEAALTAPGARRFTAADLGVAGGATGGAGTLPPNAVLTRISWDGPPEYPYIHGIFGGAGAAGTGAKGGGQRIELHTAALHELSHGLRLHHRWGV